MPALSPSMEVGTVVEWKKKVGDYVKENDVFCTIQTDKAVVDYTNTFDPGYLAKVYLENGGEAPVAQTIALLVTSEADIPKVSNYYPEDAAGAAPAAAAPAKAAAAATPAAAAPAAAKAPRGEALTKAIHDSGPSVVRIAAGLSAEALEKIVPTGKGGRYLKSDFAGVKGFDYNENVQVVSLDGPAAISKTASPAAAAKPAAATPAAAAGDIYNVVIQGTPVKVRVDDSKLLDTLISTMTIPKKKVAKGATPK
ncbi:dihydrolipoamide acetyltransferase precursorlike protein [Angomonas deanei]|nr:dihydrolipoamide acetyltransferase precursorlike protein [Angomonas deanei]|eukprot:EPY25045.1 dihydrolipoamide acetyltransferase precursorlike protein [Angomonas deanei]